MQNQNTKFERLYQQIAPLPPITAAVIYPESEDAVLGAVRATQEGLITPIFLCDKEHVQELAVTAKVDISPYQLFDCSPQEAVTRGVSMARSGEAHTLIKGSVSTEALMSEVVNGERGLRTGKKMSHCMVVDIFSHKKLLIFSDPALNILPPLADKKDIVQNAINLAHALGIVQPKVALISTTETVNDKIASTQEYAVLCKMAERGQITGALLDGPLSLDLAISTRSTKMKKLQSQVSGDADILIFPNLECANIFSKTLEYFSSCFSAGLVVGAKVPIVMTSRSSEAITRVFSCALAKFYHYHK